MIEYIFSYIMAYVLIGSIQSARNSRSGLFYSHELHRPFPLTKFGLRSHGKTVVTV